MNIERYPEDEDEEEQIKLFYEHPCGRIKQNCCIVMGLKKPKLQEKALLGSCQHLKEREKRRKWKIKERNKDRNRKYVWLE